MARILHLEASPGWGGQEMRILKEACGMRERGHSVVFAVMKRGLLIEQAREEGFAVYEIDFHKAWWLFALIRLLRILCKERIQVVNTHSSLDSWIGGIAARIRGIPVIRTRHLSTPIKPGLNSRLLYGKLADFVVTTCSGIIPMIANQAKRAHSSIRSIPTGVDIKRIECAEPPFDLKKALGLAPDSCLIGTACFMRSWKGIGDFLQAAHLLRRETKLRWIVIGGGQEDVYRAKAAELRLGGIVYFTGHLARPIPTIRALDIFALLSTAHEGVSQAILQAAYFEKPLIATLTGGLCEVCLDGKTGICVPRFSPEEVAQAALELMENPELRRNMGQEARKLVLNRFTHGHMLDAMEEVYSKLNLRKGL